MASYDLSIYLTSRPFSQFPCTALMEGPLPAIKAVQGIVSGL